LRIVINGPRRPVIMRPRGYRTGLMA
jgi:hypothetical protein